METAKDKFEKLVELRKSLRSDANIAYIMQAIVNHIEKGYDLYLQLKPLYKAIKLEALEADEILSCDKEFPSDNVGIFTEEDDKDDDGNYLYPARYASKAFN